MGWAAGELGVFECGELAWWPGHLPFPRLRSFIQPFAHEAQLMAGHLRAEQVCVWRGV